MAAWMLGEREWSAGPMVITSNTKRPSSSSRGTPEDGAGGVVGEHQLALAQPDDALVHRVQREPLEVHGGTELVAAGGDVLGQVLGQGDVVAQRSTNRAITHSTTAIANSNHSTVCGAPSSGVRTTLRKNTTTSGISATREAPMMMRSLTRSVTSIGLG